MHESQLLGNLIRRGQDAFYSRTKFSERDDLKSLFGLMPYVDNLRKKVSLSFLALLCTKIFGLQIY